jgi:tryptophanyl-tRNA synthetase
MYVNVGLSFLCSLQEAFQVPLVIQITDDEKFLFKPDLSLEACHDMGYSNAKDIIALGFDQEKVFLHRFS